MTSILVPYENAMRLGMGFNTYTHALCINDAVQKPGGVKATEDDLKNKEDFSTVSQKVTYSSKYVDKVSDVMSSLNISGSLEIKLQSIGAGGQAKASFVDTDKFKDSDLNCLVQVKVMNSKLIADDVTEFIPIENVVPSQFTEVYGDSFISGFIEGGELNGLVSIKLKDRSKARDLQAELKINAPFAGGAIDVSGEGSVAMKNNESSVQGERTISVSWLGGGDIKGQSATDWTIDALKDAAFNFPSRVAQTPQRTYAIVTKYTALRSFQEKTVRGTPLDYENAGVYTSTLLEAYLEYKSILKDLQMMSWDLEHKLIELEKGTETAAQATYRTSLKSSYDKLKTSYNTRNASFTAMQEKKPTEADHDALVKYQRELAAEERKLLQPLEPNEVKVYEPDLYGLDQAHTDCRFEMIKIVREVDAVTFDPKVAIDPDRKHVFLSPAIFRLLVPKAVIPKANQVAPEGAWRTSPIKTQDTQQYSAEYNEIGVSISRTTRTNTLALHPVWHGSRIQLLHAGTRKVLDFGGAGGMTWLYHTLLHGHENQTMTLECENLPRLNDPLAINSWMLRTKIGALEMNHVASDDKLLSRVLNPKADDKASLQRWYISKSPIDPLCVRITSAAWPNSFLQAYGSGLTEIRLLPLPADERLCDFQLLSVA
ncbi:uncharacterized protein RHO25_008011 [Cercospora beticola]|uniref:DUF4139 domain-containing protein n=2 Tax=Cercospora beticola TaxID=122368 RepID=A0ABZ0NUT9_CERBT|nr:hypothetical protein RHO25_008011 [Cercospora beticola]